MISWEYIPSPKEIDQTIDDYRSQSRRIDGKSAYSPKELKHFILATVICKKSEIKSDVFFRALFKRHKEMDGKLVVPLQQISTSFAEEVAYEVSINNKMSTPEEKAKHDAFLNQDQLLEEDKRYQSAVKCESQCIPDYYYAIEREKISGIVPLSSHTKQIEMLENIQQGVRCHVI